MERKTGFYDINMLQNCSKCCPWDHDGFIEPENQLWQNWAFNKSRFGTVLVTYTRQSAAECLPLPVWGRARKMLIRDGAGRRGWKAK